MARRWLGGDAGQGGLESFRFDFAQAAEALSRALNGGRHVLLYGPPRQGKSLLVKSLIGAEAITLHASEDFGFADVARNVLVSSGCSVVVDQKKKRRGAAKAEIKFKTPLIEAGGSLDGGLESEDTFRTFTADIANPNDVCHLLTQLAEPPVVVIEHFERMKPANRRLLIEFLTISDENRAARFVLVASSVGAGPPLSHRELIELNRAVAFVQLPLMSNEETAGFIRAALVHLKAPAPAKALIDLVYGRLDGALEPTIDACLLIGRSDHADAGPIEAALTTGLQERFRTYLLALLSAIVEAEWDISCSRVVIWNTDEQGPPRAAAATDDDDDDDDDDDPDQLVVNPVWNSDRVFEGLRYSLRDEEDLDPPDREFEALREMAGALGRRVLQSPAQSEALRFLAFALDGFIEDPRSAARRTYVPATETQAIEVDTGLLLCAILRDADLSQPVVLTAASLKAYLEVYGLVTRYDDQRTFAKLARRIRRLQRKLYIDPPIFALNPARTSLTLWDPAQEGLYGDIKPDIEDLLEASEHEFLFEDSDRAVD